MNLRHDLRGVSKVDLVSAVLLVPTLAFGCYVIAQDAQETQRQEQTQTQTSTEDAPATDAGKRYQETLGWCTERFPYRPDLQEACQWGAYEMLPGPKYQTEEGITHASETHP